jgi:hypothetical protein
MKPLDGNFVENAKKHGVSGLCIGGTRIAGPAWRWGTQTDIKGGGFGLKRPSDGDVLARDVEGHPGGRWPSNVILGHLEGCLRVGVRKVRGNPHLGQKNPDLVKQYGGGCFGGGKVEPTGGYADEDGGETIEDWRCLEACPVAKIDQKGGVTSSKFRIEKNRGRRDESQYRIKPTPGTVKDFGDSGGASRYFKRISEFKEGEG